MQTEIKIQIEEFTIANSLISVLISISTCRYPLYFFLLFLM
jgi:hypothetical protein